MTKESLSGIDSRLVFRETFNNEQDTRKNGGIPTNVDFSKGVGSFNGTSSFLNIGCRDSLFKDSFSIRYKLKAIIDGRPSAAEYLFGIKGQADSSQSIWATNETDGDIGFFFKDSTNGVNLLTTTQPLSDGENLDKEFIFVFESGGNMYIYLDGVEIKSSSTATINPLLFDSGFDFYIGARNNLGSASNFSNVTADLLEIYKGTLTTEEVKNFYEGKTYHELPDKIEEQLGSDITRIWTIFSGSPTINGDVITFTSGENQSVRNNNYWVIEKLYKITVTVTGYLGSGDIYLPYDNANPTSDGIVSSNGTYTYYYRPKSSVNVGVFSFTGHNATVTIDSIKEIAEGTGVEKILDVHSLNGALKNTKSGDNVENIVYNDFDFTDGWGTYDSTIDSSSQFTQTAYSAGVTKTILTIGKTYRCRLVGNLSNSNVFQIKASNTFFTQTYNGDFDTDYFTFKAISDTFQIEVVNNVGTIIIISELNIKEIIPELTNTDVEIKNIGDFYSPEFNGSSSKIDAGDYDDLTGDITILSWLKIKGYGEANNGRLIDNGKFIFYTNGASARLGCVSDGATAIFSSNGSLSLNKYQFVAITRTIAGLVNFYIGDFDNAPSLSGNANQDSGTPNAGINNIILGNRNDSALTSNGFIIRISVLDGILTTEQLTQLWSSNKRYLQ